MTKYYPKWSRWLKQIEIEIRRLAIHRHTYDEVSKIILANKRIQNPSIFYSWMRNVYVTDIAIGIRKQLDQKKHAVSLAKLLEEIAQNPKQITRRRFVGKYRGIARQWANRDFNRFAATPASRYINANQVRADLRKLERLWRIPRKYVNRKIAHLDKRGVKKIPTYGDLDRCQDKLEALLKKYRFMFEAVEIDVLPTFIDDWQAIFRERWIP